MTKSNRVPELGQAVVLAAALLLSLGFARADDSAQAAAEKSTLTAVEALPPWEYDFYSQGPPSLDPTKAFARLGRPDLAIKAIPFKEADVRLSFIDEIWRLTTRRRALAADLAGAEMAKDKIVGPCARADALLAIARAQLRANQPALSRLALYAVSPLLGKKPEARGMLCYTAYLLSKSGDVPAARRLFAATSPATLPKESWPFRPEIWFEYSFKAGLGRDAVGSLSQEMWTRYTTLRTVLATKDFDLAFALADSTTNSSDRSGFLVQIGLAALGAGKWDVLNRAAESARQIAEATAPSSTAKKLETNPQDRVWNWLSLAELQEIQGLPAAEDSIDKAFAALPQVAPKDRLRYWDSENPTRERLADAHWFALAEGKSLRNFPPDRRRLICERAFQTLPASPARSRAAGLRYLIEGRTLDDGGFPLDQLLEALLAAAREEAKQAVDDNDLRDLTWLIEYYRDQGDQVNANAIAQEFLTYRVPHIPRQSSVMWLALMGLYQPAVDFVVSGQWRAENGNAVREIALAQSSNSAPSGPPAWVLNLHDPRNRSESIIAWAEGLTKPRDPKIRAEEDEIDRLSPAAMSNIQVMGMSAVS